MECGDCAIRSSVGYCHECEMLLCEECSRTCERCQKTVCKSHIQRTSSGRRICVSCVVHHYDQRAKKAKERREIRAEKAATVVHASGSKKKKKKSVPVAPAPAPEAASAGESLSFESLQEELGGISAGPAVMEEERPRAFSPLVDEATLNERVLTGSASARKPTWTGGLVLACVGWVLFLAAFTGSSLGIQQYIFNLLAVVLSFGAVLWTGPSAFSKDNVAFRVHSRVVLAIGLGGLAFSGLVLYIRITG